MRSRIVMSLLVPLIAAACASNASNPQADIATLKNQLVAFEQLKEPDTEMYLALLTEDVTFLPPDSKAIVGKQAVRAFVKAAAAPVSSVRLDYSDPIIDLSGDLAVRRADQVVSLNDKPVDRKKILDVLKRQPDGSWKIAVRSWGSNE